jgi:hypothetical protein
MTSVTNFTSHLSDELVALVHGYTPKPTTTVTQDHLDIAKARIAGKYTISEDGQHWISTSQNKAVEVNCYGSRIAYSASRWCYLIEYGIQEKHDDSAIQRICFQQYCINPQHQVLTSKSWTSFQCEGDWVYLQCFINNNTTVESDHLIWTGYADAQGPRSHGVRVTHLVYFLKHRVTSIPVGYNVVKVKTCTTKSCVAIAHLTLSPNNWNPVTEITETFCTEAKNFILGCVISSVGGHWISKYKTTESTPYPSTDFQGKRWRLNRLSWVAFNNKLPPANLIVRHKCPVKACFRPGCLEIGTHAENARDKIRDDTHMRGERNHFASITESTARDIKKSKGQGTPTERAERFGTTATVVRRIDSGRNWSWIVI